MERQALEQRLLIWLLRLFGGTTCLAVFAVLMPTEWMAATHEWLGAGAFPRAPIVEYLTRSISLLYAVHGGIILLASTDIRRYQTLITYLAVADGTLGLILIGVDAFAGMPWYWTAAEGPLVIGPSAVLLHLNLRVQARRRSGAEADEEAFMSGRLGPEG